MQKTDRNWFKLNLKFLFFRHYNVLFGFSSNIDAQKQWKNLSSCIKSYRQRGSKAIKMNRYTDSFDLLIEMTSEASNFCKNINKIS